MGRDGVLRRYALAMVRLGVDAATIRAQRLTRQGLATPIRSSPQGSAVRWRHGDLGKLSTQDVVALGPAGRTVRLAAGASVRRVGLLARRGALVLVWLTMPLDGARLAAVAIAVTVGGLAVGRLFLSVTAYA